MPKNVFDLGFEEKPNFWLVSKQQIYTKVMYKKGLGLTTQRERPKCFWLIQKDLTRVV